MLLTSLMVLREVNPLLLSLLQLLLMIKIKKFQRFDPNKYKIEAKVLQLVIQKMRKSHPILKQILRQKLKHKLNLMKRWENLRSNRWI